MAKKTGKAFGTGSLSQLEAQQRQFEQEAQKLREQLEEAERKRKENNQLLQEAKIRTLGEETQPYVVKFNQLNLNIFDFLKDACGAIERGEAVIVSGKEYKKTIAKEAPKTVVPEEKEEEETAE